MFYSFLFFILHYLHKYIQFVENTGLIPLDSPLSVTCGDTSPIGRVRQIAAKVLPLGELSAKQTERTRLRTPSPSFRPFP